MARKALVVALALLAFQQLAFLITWTRQGAVHRAHTRTACASTRDPKDVFDDVFQDMEPNAIYTQARVERREYLMKLATENLAIINDVFDTMAHEVVSLDAKSWATDAQQLAAKNASPKKTFLATLRGSGGGKTRALEEIRWELLGMEGVLPLAITYNSAMSLIRAELKISTNDEINFAMTVVARLAAVFYGKPLDEILDMLRQRAWSGGLKYPIQLIRAFIRHVVAKLRQSDMEVKTIVILADEVASAEEQIAPAVTAVLHQAVLDESILADLQATVVISSLTLCPPPAIFLVTLFFALLCGQLCVPE